MDFDDKPRRFPNIAPKKTIGSSKVSKVSDVTRMLDGALNTLGEQLEKLALRSRVSTFDEKESRVLQGYIKSLVDLSREERERDKADTLGAELSKLSDAELLELAKSKLLEAKDTK
jgi:hypothetical protein